MYFQKNQERFDRLELACVSAGGTVEYERNYGYYTNCFKAAPSVNVNNNMSGSRGIINTCVLDSISIFGKIENLPVSQCEITDLQIDNKF